MNSILTSVIAVTGIAGGLAFLLSLANNTIGNYGLKKLTINADRTLDVEGGSSLLSTLMEQDIFIPSACGGKGSCGYCKVKVLEGGGPILPTETGYVSPEEQKQFVRLACQCKVKEDLSIQIPEELFNVKQQVYKVAFGRPVTPTIKHLRLELPPGEEIHFKPGQYIQILTPVYKENDEEVYRAYSIASSPDDVGAVELFIGQVPEGKCSTYVHKYLKEGDKLTVVGPFGDFHYQDTQRPMVMVAISTGLAPIMAILKYMVHHDIQREATFYFGARCGADLLMVDELRAIEAKLPNFKFVPCLSRPTEEDAWTGEKGRVTDLIERYLENASEAEAYLCGSPVMIDSVVELLQKKGMPDAQIFYDKFE